MIGVQIGTYRPGSPNGMTIEETYLEPDAEHPRGQAFDGAGNPMPLHGPDLPREIGAAFELSLFTEMFPTMLSLNSGDSDARAFSRR